ncbi:hypothetical protein [Daejeonella lutea]|uniref:Uncharacterized protein n=1 Tax=Daejeonella lutea TaxID=572036 RepID=A0A1T5B072_9SPHI|nr:hypothetical protein [Daejeonella lutea]SKB40479.1 hypothetical protein SAMN05661099_1162 [Daejeonella lutea]
MSAKPNHSNLEAAIRKLGGFFSSQFRLKSSEDLRDSFDCFLTDEPVSLESAEELKVTNYFTILEEIIGVLHELEEQLISEGVKSQAEETSQVDSSNRLYASLKRHPE